MLGRAGFRTRKRIFAENQEIKNGIDKQNSTPSFATFEKNLFFAIIFIKAVIV